MQYFFFRQKLDSTVQEVINSYEDLEILLNKPEFVEELKRDIEKSYPNYMQMLEKRRKDMEKNDHGVVFAGLC